MKTGVKQTQEGYQVWFKIGNQTFFLEEHIEETKEQSLKTAKAFENMLNIAFEKLQKNQQSK